VRQRTKFIKVTPEQITIEVWGSILDYPNEKQDSDPVVILHKYDGSHVDLTDKVLACQFRKEDVTLWIDSKVVLDQREFSVFSTRGLWIDHHPFSFTTHYGTLSEVLLVERDRRVY